MEYTSTRDNTVSVESAVAIAKGISDDGGLFVPKSIPTLTKDDMDELIGLDYVGRAVKILGMYLTDFTKDELYECARGAYIGSFDDDIYLNCGTARPAPLRIWPFRFCRGCLQKRRRKPMADVPRLCLSQRRAIPERPLWRVLPMLREPKYWFFIPKTASAICKSCKWLPKAEIMLRFVQ